MTTFKSKTFAILSTFLLAWVVPMAGPSAALAEKEEPPTITQMNLYVEEGLLTVDISARGLLSERVVGTVQSGLPAVLELFFDLTESDRKTVVQKGARSYSLKYDVWDDVYSVAGQDSTTRLPTFEAMRFFVEHMKSIRLVPVSRMLSDRSYFVEMSVAVSPLQGTERRKVDGWIKENVRKEGEGPWHEQLLNVSDLITHFLSREKDSAKRSRLFRSTVFRPGLLPVRDKEGG
ncbi:MAG: DUF4390 domain-containing protein [Candidatus Eisenbacteria bacterium]